jgi:hypothetical protein
MVAFKFHTGAVRVRVPPPGNLALVLRGNYKNASPPLPHELQKYFSSNTQTITLGPG